MKLSAFYQNKKCFLGFHKWRTVKDNGYTKYRECDRCGGRMITQPKNGGYQPIEIGFITEKSKK